MKSRPIITISRDPFARTEFVRQSVPAGRECSFCDRPARFRYGSASDGGRVGLDVRPFCSASCFRAFTG